MYLMNFAEIQNRGIVYYYKGKLSHELHYPQTSSLQSQPTTFSLSFPLPVTAQGFIPWSLLTCFSASSNSLFPFAVSRTFFLLFSLLLRPQGKGRKKRSLPAFFSLLQIFKEFSVFLVFPIGFSFPAFLCFLLPCSSFSWFVNFFFRPNWDINKVAAGDPNICQFLLTKFSLFLWQVLSTSSIY